MQWTVPGKLWTSAAISVLVFSSPGIQDEKTKGAQNMSSMLGRLLDFRGSFLSLL